MAQRQTARGRVVRQKVKNAPCPYPADNRIERGSNFCGWFCGYPGPGCSAVRTEAADCAGGYTKLGFASHPGTRTADHNQWFGNVELVVAKEVGQETVQYVNNIYKYYVAYKLTLAESTSKGADGH